MKALLSQRGVPYVERNVAADPQALADLFNRTGTEAVPVTVIDNEVVIGFDRPRLEYLLARGAASPIRLGAAVADAERIAAKKGEGLTLGAYVGGVRSGSIAARVGLQQGDVIVELAGQPIRASADIDRAIASLRRGQTSTLTYIRGRQHQRVQFVV